MENRPRTDLVDLLAEIVRAGGGFALRPTSADAYVPRRIGGGWHRVERKRRGGETGLMLLERTARDVLAGTERDAT